MHYSTLQEDFIRTQLVKMWLIMFCSEQNIGSHFRLEQISRHLVRLAHNMQVFDTVRTSLATVTRMLFEIERNWHYSSPAVAYQPRTVGRPRFEIPREQLQYLVDYEITIPEMSRALLKRAQETFRLAKRTLRR